MNDRQRADYLEIELKRARTEANKLRKALHQNSRHAQRVQRAYDAALLMAVRHCGYASTSRKVMAGQGVSQRQWENGRALLILARVHNGKRFLVHDLATIEAALKRAKLRAVESPQSFSLRLPRHG